MRDGTSSSRQEFIEDDSSAEPIEHNEPTLVENPEEDNNDAPRKSKRQRTVKSFGDDFIVYLIDDTPRTIEEAYFVRPGAAGLLIGIECCRVRYMSWMYLTSCNYPNRRRTSYKYKENYPIVL